MAPRRFLLALPALLAFAVYLPVLRNGLVFDDAILFAEGAYADAGRPWTEVLTDSFGGSSNYFRPLVVLTFLMESWLGLAAIPAALHATNLVLHAANTALVTALAIRLRGTSTARDGVPVVAGLLYGLHPALIEGVAWVASRFDLLATTFLLLALLADATLRRPGLRAAAVAGAFLLAALSKEMAVCFAVVYPLWRLARGRRAFPPRTLATLAVAGAAYLAARYASLGHLLTDEGAHPAPAGGPLSAVLLVGRSAAEYACLVLWPLGRPAPIRWSARPVPPTDVLAWVGLAAGILAAAYWIARTRKGSRHAPLALAGAAALLPVLNLIPLELPGGNVAADRYLVFPLALFALAAAGVLGRLRKSRPAIAVWALAAIVAISVTLPHWRDGISFWTWAERRTPQSVVPYFNLCNEHGARGEWANVEAAARRGLERHPRSPELWNSLGLALVQQERPKDAEAAYRASLAADDAEPLVWSNLARALVLQGRQDEALTILRERALALDAEHPRANLNLAAILLARGRPDLAAAPLAWARAGLGGSHAVVARLDEALADPRRWLHCGDALREQGDLAAARAAYEEAARLAPDDPAARRRLQALDD